MNKTKGLTTIELLVVIAIIVILTSIVVVKVKVIPSINKGKDAFITENVSTILISAVDFYDSHTSYAGFCASNGVTNPQRSIASVGGALSCVVNDSADAWCACSTLKAVPGQVFCVDSRGSKKESANTCTTACPANGACI